MYLLNPDTGRLFDDSGNLILQEKGTPLYDEYKEWRRQGNKVKLTAQLTQEDQVNLGKQSIDFAYDMHEQNGLEASRAFERFLVAEFIIYNRLTEQQAKDVGAFLKDPILILKTGQWKNTLDEVNRLVVSEAYMQTYYDKFKEDLQYYILNNYENNDNISSKEHIQTKSVRQSGKDQ